MQEEAWESSWWMLNSTWWCVLILTPSSDIYRREPQAARRPSASNPSRTNIVSQWEAATSKEVSRLWSGLVGQLGGRPTAYCHQLPPFFFWWAVLAFLWSKHWVMACPKQFCFGLWACFDPTEPESCSLIGLRLLPWIVECVSLPLRCVFYLISPAYKYLPTLMKMVSNRPIPLYWYLHFMCLYRNWWRKIDI